MRDGAFVAPYLTLLPLEAGRRRRGLREVFDAPKWITRAGAPWRTAANDFTPRGAAYRQARRGKRQPVALTRVLHALRAAPYLASGRPPDPTAACFRRLARDYERLPKAATRLHYVAFGCLLPRRAIARRRSITRSSGPSSRRPRG